MRIRVHRLMLALGLALGAPYTAYAAQDMNPQDVEKLLDQRLKVEESSEAKQEQLALAKRKRLEVISQGDTVLDELNLLDKVVKTWEQRLKALETSDEGRQLAADPLNVETFRALQKDKPITPGDISTLKSKIEIALAPLKAARDGSLFIPGESVIAAIQEDAVATRSAIERYERLQAKLTFLLSKSSGQPIKPGSPSLKIALEEYERAQSERELAFDRETRKKTDEIIRQAKREEDEAKAKMEAERIRQETRRMAAQSEHDRLIKEATSDQVRRKFAPFLSSGKFQLGVLPCHYPYRWGEGDREGPISYNALVKCKALSDAKLFADYASHPGNDRPRWPKPVSNADKDKMEALLAEFNRYAQIWLEQGLLAK